MTVWLRCCGLGYGHLFVQPYCTLRQLLDHGLQDPDNAIGDDDESPGQLLARSHQLEANLRK